MLAVITGVGRRGQLGEAVADAFVARGARVRLIDRDATALMERVHELRAKGADCEGYPCDLTDPEAVAAVASRLDRVDALACLAGGFAMSGTVSDDAIATWSRMWALNATTAWCTTRAFLPALRAARGSIVYMAAAAALAGGRMAGMSAYVASKSAVIALMQAVAQDEKDSGVRANAIAPTAIRTGDNLANMGEKVSYVEREVIAGWIAHLCSPAGANMTGQVIRLA